MTASQSAMATVSQADSEQYEDVYVHRVYEQIASHFSSTRYKVIFPDRKDIGLPMANPEATNVIGSLGQMLNNSYAVFQMELLA